MSSLGFLLLAAVCFALVYGLCKAVSALEDKTREWGIYYSFTPLFAHFVVPIIAPILGVVFLIGVVCLFLAFSK